MNMKNRKILNLLIIAVFCAVAIWKFNPPQVSDTAYSQEELDKVSSFILYRKRLTEAMYDYCLSYNYRLDIFIQKFNELHSRQIEEAESFITKFQPQERLAFYKEINNAFAEQKPEFFAQIEKNYDENKRLMSLVNQSLTRQDFCKWIDEHPTELFKGKTDNEVMPL